MRQMMRREAVVVTTNGHLGFGPWEQSYWRGLPGIDVFGPTC
jgi:hypothetical protein